MRDLDLTLDYMENARFNYIYGPIIAHLDTAFTNTELLCLSMIYHKFALMNGPRAKYITQMQLGNILEHMFNVSDRDFNVAIVSRISFDPECVDPKYTADGHVSLSSFIRMFTIYFSKDLEKRMNFVFGIYDEHDRGYLDREQVVKYVNKFFYSDDEDEVQELRADMVEMIFSKFDLDKDMLISMDEYMDVVRKQPMMMEFLGRIFPTESQLDTVSHCVNLLS
ncbi:EF-hand calcium-binding domain-containing protein 1-like [Drosophila innubila]|uniref:EF-hand calcium-binding domain-containing protein 1-like n=1 Tax=Drosophila innubila TaxID=198719 RepID=UPI00148D7C9E|nr:EF-hand calcium-binding domain-containing protein 1-like [Drosophila innubila]XP_034478162.1 EF-hand calcium-binding domain-containing protein 1-like [Drosophila innubila]